MPTGSITGPKGLTQSTGLGDMSVGARFWVWRPPTESRQNIQIGFSLKVPTGKPNVTSLITGTATPSTAPTTVDQSIQLGDAGTGIAIDYLAYKALPARFTLFSTGVYLLNPRNTYTATTPARAPCRFPTNTFCGRESATPFPNSAELR